MPVKRIWMSDGLIFRRQLVRIQPQAPVKLILGERIMIKCDYLIVGAGMAGATLGYLLQKNGYDVIILEREDLSKKEKVCAGLLTSRFYSLLISLYPKEEIDALVKKVHPKISIYLDQNKIKQGVSNYKVTLRRELDAYVVKKYQQLNGRVLENTKITNVDFQNNYINTNRGKIRYQKLIAADGVNSLLRQKLFGEGQDKILIIQNFQKNNIGLEDIIINTSVDFIGFTYLFPVGDQICLGSLGNDKQLIVEKFKETAKRYGLKDEKIRGHFIPLGNNIVLQKDNIYFIGDAAGFTSGFTGEGMYHACYSAIQLFKSFTSDADYASLVDRLTQEAKSGAAQTLSLEKEGIFAVLHW